MTDRTGIWVEAATAIALTLALLAVALSSGLVAVGLWAL